MLAKSCGPAEKSVNARKDAQRAERNAFDEHLVDGLHLVRGDHDDQVLQRVGLGVGAAVVARAGLVGGEDGHHVAADDPAFKHPTKPIGSFMSEAVAQRLASVLRERDSLCRLEGEGDEQQEEERLSDGLQAAVPGESRPLGGWARWRPR